jgi:hypothetical protein
VSVDLCIKLDTINWKEARKVLAVTDPKTGKLKPLPVGAVDLFKTFAWRQFDESGKVYLSQRAWLELTGRSKSSFYEQLDYLITLGLVKRLNKGSNINNLRANYKVSETRLESLPKIVRYTGQTEKDIVLDTEQVSPVGNTSLSGMVEAKRNKRNKTNGSFNDDYFNFVIGCLPHDLRDNLTNSKELNDLLVELLENKGYSFQQIKNKLNPSHRWQGIHTPYPFVLKYLRELLREQPVAKLSDPIRVNSDLEQDIGKHLATAENLKAMREALNQGG